MNIIIAGGTGLIGKALAGYLVERGHHVTILTRGNPMTMGNPNIQFVRWDGKTADAWSYLVEESDAIVNLAGASIGGGLWTKKRKKIIAESRLNAGQALVDAVLKSSRKPQVFLQVSGIGYYPSDNNKIFTPASPPGEGFLADTAVLWEKSTQPIEEVGIRRVVMRTSPVLSSISGILKMTSLPFKLFAGGPLGSGEQWWAWIHIHDAVAAMAFIIENSQIHGTLHLTSPNPQRMKDFGRILARVLKRPYWFPVPGFALKIVLGEMSELVLGGQRVYPDDLVSAGFKFQYPELEMALKSLLK